MSSQQSLAGTKVVDAVGAPLLVYHGTNVAFAEFDTRRGDASILPTNTLGSFFTPSAAVAARYAGYKGGDTVVHVYLDLQDPLIVDFKEMQRAIGSKKTLSELRSRIGDRGAIVMRGGEVHEYIATKPEQITRTVPDTKFGSSMERVDEFAAPRKWRGRRANRPGTHSEHEVDQCQH